MTEVRFYHLQRSALEQALPKLLEKTLERGWRAVVMAGSEDRVEALNAVLWNYSREGFLPHGSKKDGYPDRQPVWLTDQDENPNAATVLFLVDGVDWRKSRNSTFVAKCSTDAMTTRSRSPVSTGSSARIPVLHSRIGSKRNRAPGRRKPKAPPNRTSHGLVRNSRSMHRGNAYIRVSKRSIRVKKI